MKDIHATTIGYLRLEHHAMFTAVYAYGHLARIVTGGTQKERETTSTTVWEHAATTAGTGW